MQLFGSVTSGRFLAKAQGGRYPLAFSLGPGGRSDNQVCEEFFQKCKAHLVKGGLRSLTPVVHETFKFLKFHSEQDRKELQFHMDPVITKKMWTLVERAHPMVMACAYSVTPGRRSAGASQGRLNALSQASSQGDKASSE
eukprot:CAMPEP_0172210326 /NCGR_PEP_ID=MMETSP1050-20130122/35681_1 /TAXON_ID=233186 /ORGANISM="Cryptomonas curvata, Strain CCAP979/52" /LENGTH=139 /DNA_ID=CAMNT_0012890447 /DNA_START=469 /DNA_END=885 /DNA_ORIENTATION=-